MHFTTRMEKKNYLLELIYRPIMQFINVPYALERNRCHDEMVALLTNFAAVELSECRSYRIREPRISLMI